MTTTTRLTDREMQVMQLVAVGQCDSQIASALYVQPQTVNRHRQRIYGKLGVCNAAASVQVINATVLSRSQSIQLAARAATSRGEGLL